MECFRLSVHLAALVEELASFGARLTERIDWLSGRPLNASQDYVEWRSAVERADNGSLAELASLLRSDRGLNPDARDLIADLLERHRLVRKRGRQAMPAYRITLKEGKSRMAAKLVEYHRKRGLRLEDAVQAALRENKRKDLELAGDVRGYTFTDEQIDELITEEEFDYLENRVRRSKPK